MSARSITRCPDSEEAQLGKRSPICESEEMDFRNQKSFRAHNSLQQTRIVGKEHQEHFTTITNQLIIKVELSKILTGKVQDFAILERNQDLKKEVYSIILQQDEDTQQICFLESRNKEQHHTKILAYKTGSFILSDLMPIEDNLNHKALLFVQTPRETPKEGQKKAEMVLFLREKKLYKVFIKVVAEVEGLPTLFRISNAHNSLAVFVQKTKLYLLFGLKDPEWHEKVSSQVISIIPTQAIFQQPIVESCLQESLYPIDQLDKDILYTAFLFANGKVGILTASKSRMEQVGKLIEVDTMATHLGKSKLKATKMFFKPIYNTLIVISETTERDYHIDLFSLTFEKKDNSYIQVVPHGHNYFVNRSMLVEEGRITDIHFAITETYVNQSLELLVIPQDMKKFTAFKFKFNKETNQHEEVRFGQLENNHLIRRDQNDMRMQMLARLVGRSPLDMLDPDRTDNEDELFEDFHALASGSPADQRVNPVLQEFGEEGQTRAPRAADAVPAAPPVPIFKQVISSNLDGCVQFDSRHNITANCNAFVDKSKQIMYIFKK
jgi:hypothetical protein